MEVSLFEFFSHLELGAGLEGLDLEQRAGNGGRDLELVADTGGW